MTTMMKCKWIALYDFLRKFILRLMPFTSCVAYIYIAYIDELPAARFPRKIIYWHLIFSLKKDRRITFILPTIQQYDEK